MSGFGLKKCAPRKGGRNSPSALVERLRAQRPMLSVWAASPGEQAASKFPCPRETSTREVR